MAERDELARLIDPLAFSKANYDLRARWRRSAKVSADRILAAGWRSPATLQAERGQLEARVAELETAMQAERAAREVAERTHGERLDALATEIAALRADLEIADRRAEAAEREATLLRVYLAQIKDRTLGDSYGMGNDIAVIVEAALEDQRITKEE